MDTSTAVAIYWDFENLHAGVLEAQAGEGAYTRPDVRFKPQEPVVDIQAIVELAATFGPVAINRAYGNWQFFSRYRDALLQNGVELIQLFPPGASAKNGADIKLCLDAAEDITRFAHIQTVIIVGGDSDFMPLAQKIKAAGRTLIGVGTRKNTNRHWAKSCHEFRFYDAFASGADAPAVVTTSTAPAPVPAPALPGQDQVLKAIRLLAEAKGDPWVNKASIWAMLKRMDGTFNPQELGQASFSDLLKSLDGVVELRKGDVDHQYRVR